MARAGETVVLVPRQVEIKRLDLLEWDDRDPQRPIGIVDLTCSAGTYVRALARDLGARLGSGAYLGALVRTGSGPFTLEGARSLDEIRGAAAASGPEGVRELLLPPDTGLEDLPAVSLTPSEIADAGQGRFVRPEAGIRDAADGAALRLLNADGAIVGMGRRDGPRVAPTKILHR